MAPVIVVYRTPKADLREVIDACIGTGPAALDAFLPEAFGSSQTVRFRHDPFRADGRRADVAAGVTSREGTDAVDVPNGRAA